MGGCNVVAILSMADMYVLPVCRNCGVHEQCWICWSLSYVMKFIAAEHGRYGYSFYVKDCGVSNAEYLAHSVHMNRL